MSEAVRFIIIAAIIMSGIFVILLITPKLARFIDKKAPPDEKSEDEASDDDSENIQ